MRPEPADGWPDGPLSERAARDLLFDREDVVAVWVMDHDETTLSALVGPDPPDDAVVDVVLETEDAFEMYSYTHYETATRWVTFGEERKESEGGGTMRDTLADYRIVAGESES
ncbi:hypothetical protein GQS65_02355 [Halomarina oriensis]|uniref:Uncharacterized protein n=2 Tax=Halomarina oriensis TaxID=671145 RepID=A0A6B0GF73_9EURY|nr:hypothetical protein [Halomarina oriensis]